MTTAEAHENIGAWVRVTRKRGKHPHKQRAKIVAVTNGSVEVKPIKHGKTELVDAADLALWKSQNAKEAALRERK